MESVLKGCKTAFGEHIQHQSMLFPIQKISLLINYCNPLSFQLQFINVFRNSVKGDNQSLEQLISIWDEQGHIQASPSSAGYIL